MSAAARSKAREGLLDRVLLERVLAAGGVVVDRLLGLAGLLEVHRQHRRELADALRVELLERLADLAVQLAALLLEQRAVGRVLDERVAEQVLELRAQRREPDRGPSPRACRAAMSRGHRSPPPPTTRSSTRTGNWRPITAAIRRLRFAASGSWSIRASSRPWRVSGISTPPTSSVATQRSPCGDDHAALDQHPDDLLDEERVALGAGHDQVADAHRAATRSRAGSRRASGCRRRSAARAGSR